jgi:hypothetical protein
MEENFDSKFRNSFAAYFFYSFPIFSNPMSDKGEKNLQNYFS